MAIVQALVIFFLWDNEESFWKKHFSENFSARKLHVLFRGWNVRLLRKYYNEVSFYMALFLLRWNCEKVSSSASAWGHDDISEKFSARKFHVERLEIEVAKIAPYSIIHIKFIIIESM